MPTRTEELAPDSSPRVISAAPESVWTREGTKPSRSSLSSSQPNMCGERSSASTEDASQRSEGLLMHAISERIELTAHSSFGPSSPNVFFP